MKALFLPIIVAFSLTALLGCEGATSNVSGPANWREPDGGLSSKAEIAQEKAQAINDALSKKECDIVGGKACEPAEKPFLSWGWLMDEIKYRNNFGKAEVMEGVANAD